MGVSSGASGFQAYSGSNEVFVVGGRVHRPTPFWFGLRWVERKLRLGPVDRLRLVQPHRWHTRCRRRGDVSRLEPVSLLLTRAAPHRLLYRKPSNTAYGNNLPSQAA